MTASMVTLPPPIPGKVLDGHEITGMGYLHGACPSGQGTLAYLHNPLGDNEDVCGGGVNSYTYLSNAGKPQFYVLGFKF